jgi:hypothetical protein
MVIKQDKILFIWLPILFSAKLSNLKTNIPVILDSLPATDSIVISDSARAKQDSAKDRFVEAYFNVKIFSDCRLLAIVYFIHQKILHSACLKMLYGAVKARLAVIPFTFSRLIKT